MSSKTDNAGKKRKRQGESSLDSTNKSTKEGRKTVKLTFPETDKWTPIIADTPGLVFPKSIPLQPYTKPRAKSASTAGRGVVDTTEFLLHSSTHAQLDYIAREEELGAVPLRKHYVGVYDPETGKLEVVEARKMIVKGIVRAHELEADEENQNMNYRDQKTALGEEFGTRKAKKMLASMTENAIGPQRIAGSKSVKLDKAAAAVMATMTEATAGMATQAQLAEKADLAKPRPIANMDAQNVKDVYTVENLVGEDIFKSIPVLDWQESANEKKEVLVGSRFVASRLMRLADNIEKLKILRFILYLIEFFKSTKPSRGKNRKLGTKAETQEALGYPPEQIVGSIKGRFATGGEMTAFQVDLLMTHIAALACLVDNFVVDMFELRHDLLLEAKQMQQYFQEIGARLAAFPAAEMKRLRLEKAAVQQRKIAKLELPLTFPKVSFGRKVR